MARSAHYTIKGFLYQFNKTALEILDAPDSAIVNIEGVLEDVEVVSPDKTIGIQCKYHEAVASFTPSAIYKPLLQMLGHFSTHPTECLDYVIFAHFPGATECPPGVGKAECEAALASTDKALKSLVAAVSPTVDVDRFLGKFRMEFGPSYDDLVVQVAQALETCGIPPGDIETLAYPNAIHIIAGIAILHDCAERRITRQQFLDRLNNIRTTAISRWTMALKSRKKLLEARRNQLKTNLDKNSRLRYLVIDPQSFSDYDGIVLFVHDYIDKYHFKPAHINTPVLCICDSREHVQDIQHRLYTKGIVSTDGYIGARFEEGYFFREPFSNKHGKGAIQREFSLRITNWGDHGSVLNNRKCDDLFILGEANCTPLDTVDVNVECLACSTIKELRFLMGVSNVYE